MPDQPADVPSGATIRAHRQKAGLSTGAYARLLGVTRGTVEHWEHERTTPRPQHRARLDALLAQPPGELEQQPAPAAEPASAAMQTCADLIVASGDELYLVQVKSWSCAAAPAFTRRITAAFQRDGLRVYREQLPGDEDEGEGTEITLSSS